MTAVNTELFDRNPIKTREDFKQYCLRKLGNGIITLNLTNEQIDDCINDAVKWCQEFLDEGNFLEFYVHKINQDDLNRHYFQLTDDVLAVHDFIYETNYIGSTLNNIFQLSTIALVNNLTVPSSGLSDWYFMKMNLETLNALMRGACPWRFDYNNARLYVDQDWATYFPLNHYVVAQLWTATNPSTNVKMWNNNYMKKYAIALLQEQWGNNLIKYEGIKLPGGINLNANKIIENAQSQLTKLQEEVIQYSSNPLPRWVSVMG